MELASYSHFISLGVISSSFIKYIGASVVLGVPQCSHCPNSILQAHGRLSHRATIKGLIVAARLYERHVVILYGKEAFVSVQYMSRISTKVKKELGMIQHTIPL